MHVASFAFTSAGRRTFVGLEVTDPFSGVITDGVTAGSIYDPSIAQDAWVTANASDVGKITTHGLVPGASYQLKLFASRGNDDAGRGRVTRYTAGGQTAELNVAMNTSNQAVIDGVLADADGRIEIEVRAAGTSRSGHLGALEITRQAAAGATPFFSQTFNSSTSLAAYAADLPTSAQFHHLGTDGAPEAWSVAGGRLRLTAAGTPAGFRRYAQADLAPQVVAVRFKVGVSNIDTNNDVAVWDIGQIGDVSGYGGSTPNPQVADRLILKGGGTNAFRFRLNGVSSPIYPANGALLSVVWVVNRSAADFTYASPSGAPETVSAERADLWVQGVKLFDDAAHLSSFGSSTLTGFRFRGTGAFTMDLDDVLVEDLQQ